MNTGYRVITSLMGFLTTPNLTKWEFLAKFGEGH